MSRLHRTVLVTACLLAFAVAAIAAEEATPKRRPNVVFIAIDDLNDWVGCYGDPQSKTPNIDRLAAMGMRFDRAYCPAPLCNPSRTALWTGIRPHVSGVYCNDVWFRDLPDLQEVVTLPQTFAKAGYRVMGGGKLFHHTPRMEMGDPASWATCYGKSCGTRFPRKRWQHGLQEQFTNAYYQQSLDWGPCPKGGGDVDNATWAAKFLSRTKAGDAPFFLAVGIFRPHLPWYAPQDCFDRFEVEDIILPTVKEDDHLDLPPRGLKAVNNGNAFGAISGSGKWQEAVRGYLASIAHADDCVGKVIDALEKSAVKNDTIVVLWSDHGFHLGEKQHWSKFTLWERANRAPYIVVAPGVTEAGTVCTTPVSTMHTYATLCDLAGIEVPAQVVDGSLRPLLADPEAEWDLPALMTHREGNHAVRDARYRYIRYRDGTEELYDQEADPHEWTNLAKDPAHAEAKARLAGFLPKEDQPDRIDDWTEATGKEPKWRGKKKGRK